MKSKILIVEDESITALDIEETLEEFDFEVIGVATNSEKAINIIKNSECDLILLDITLEDGEDGVALGEKMQLLTDAPIIFLTANEKESTAKRAINVKPAGYILKPFRKLELISAIKIALNNHKEKTLSLDNSIELEFGYMFNLNSNSLFLNKMEVELNLKEKRFIQILAKNANRIIAYDVIEEYVYDNQEIGLGAFRSLLFRLRQKLHKDLIINISGVGYKINIAKVKKE